MDFDALLEKCGDYNRYQFILLLAFGYSNIMSSMHYFAQTIITFTPEHWCFDKELDNHTIDEIRDIYANVEHPMCTSFQNVVEETLLNNTSGVCREWIYNYESGYESVSTEFNWVCDDAYKSAVGQSFFFIGSMLGTIFFGFLADRVGRVPALLASSLTGGLGDLITSFVTTLPAFAAGRFMAGLSTDTMFYLMYIIVFEYLKPTKRTFGLNITTILFYSLGLVCAPWIAIWLGTWRAFLRFASLPMFVLTLYPLFICESAQWLITKGRITDAIKCLKRVAKINKRQVDDSVFEEFEIHYAKKIADDEANNKRKDTFLGMLHTPRLRKFTIILLIKSMIITLAFDTTARNVEGFGSSPFTLFSATSFVYIPAGLTIILLQNIIGRKGMACGSLFVGAVITATTGFLLSFLESNQNAMVLGLMVALGRYGTIVAYEAEAQYAAEIIPTSVRGRGIANVHVVGYAFNFLGAYIIFLGTYYKPLPSIVISVIMFAGAVLCLGLPETLNKKLPDTLAEGEEFGKDEKWYFFPCTSRRSAPPQDLDIEVTKL